MEMTAEDVNLTYRKGAAGPHRNGTLRELRALRDSGQLHGGNPPHGAPHVGFLYGLASRLGGISCKAYYEETGDKGYLEAPAGTGLTL